MAQSVRSQDVSDRVTELVQRGRMTLDVATADLEAARMLLGSADPVALYFQQALDDSRRAWDRLRARFGGQALDAALAEPPEAVLRIAFPLSTPDQSEVVFILIGGRTYRVEAVAGTPLAPVQYRLARLAPPLEHGPYYACRLADGSSQCDCAEWYYREDAPTAPDICKHLAALDALGWL